jgi:hypothetical protein
LTGNVHFAFGHLLCVQSRTLMAQPFDAKSFKTTGSAVTLTGQEVDQRPLFQISGVSVSQNGVLVFQSATDSTTRLVWYDPTGKELDQIPQVGYEDPDISPDGYFLAVSSDDDRNGKHFIRVYDLKRGISTRVSDGGQDHCTLIFFYSHYPDGNCRSCRTIRSVYAHLRTPTLGQYRVAPQSRKLADPLASAHDPESACRLKSQTGSVFRDCRALKSPDSVGLR